MPYFLIDRYYILLVLPVIIASLIISARMKSVYNRYSGVRNSRGITGAQAAQMVLNYYGITDVQIMTINGNLTDCYDPMQKVIKLSPGVYNGFEFSNTGKKNYNTTQRQGLLVTLRYVV